MYFIQRLVNHEDQYFLIHLVYTAKMFIFVNLEIKPEEEEEEEIDPLDAYMNEINSKLAYTSHVRGEKL